MKPSSHLNLNPGWREHGHFLGPIGPRSNRSGTCLDDLDLTLPFQLFFLSLLASLAVGVLITWEGGYDN